MRTIRRRSKFRRDYRREARSLGPEKLDGALAPLIEALASDRLLQYKHRDHPLGGTWAGHRDCHVRPDLVLIYEKPDPQQLVLTRLGSHAELFS